MPPLIGYDDAPPLIGGGGFDPFGWVRDNPQTAMGLGASLMGQPDLRTGMRQFAGIAPGLGQIDQKNQEREQRVQALGNWIDRERAAGRDIPEHTAGFLRAYPELAGKLVESSLFPGQGPEKTADIINFEYAQNNPAFAAAQNSANPPDFDDQAKLRGEYTKASSDFVAMRDSYSRIMAAAKDQTGAGDIAMIFGFMKMLDPTSVVREGEYATAANAGGVSDQIRSMYNRVINGERLTPEVRAQFMQQAGHQFKGAEARHTALTAEYRRLAEEYGFDPGVITPDLSGGVKLDADWVEVDGIKIKETSR